LIACEIQQMIDAIVIEHKEELLVEFWSYLNRPAYPKRRASDTSETKKQQEGEQEEEEIGLDSLQASYFCKTIGVLLSKYPIEVK
jgi:hypothetical protein